MKDRITEFLVRENISPAEFADKIGVQRSSVSHVLNGRNYPGASFIQKMLSTYRNLNPRWLLLGEGSMKDTNQYVMEPSLFSNPLTEEITGNKETAKKDTVIDTGGIKKNGEFTISTTAINKDESLNFPDKVIGSPDNKEIEKIIFLYKDKTFSVFTPSL